MSVLTSEQRKTLEAACIKGRRASEQAVRAALTGLFLTADRPPAHLDEEARQLRRGLRAKGRQLGDTGDSLDLLIAECAYEQWHQLLFARFLSETGLLVHPEYRAPVTLADCEDLAASLGEPDGWSVAARFAAELLPGIFRLEDPCVQLRLAAEGRLALEAIIGRLPSTVFVTDDALGWAYQFWQEERKNEVNRAERKVGGADLGPVTQLFTEDYMVRFLLQNSLGTWWASRHPKSPLIGSWEYLRVPQKDGHSAAGPFPGWPDAVADTTVLDPCCGSGHFLVEAFRMLWRMRQEEEGSTVVEAQDAVLESNLFGLELDPRCVQIAMFALSMNAWKDGGGWRALPTPNVACSGIPARTDVIEWRALAAGEQVLESALGRLHTLFREADTLGSLIDPERTAGTSSGECSQGSVDDVEWDQVAPLLDTLLSREVRDPAASVLGVDAAGLARAAEYLSRRYTLVATNVPYLVRSKQADVLRDLADRYHASARNDLATMFLEQCGRLCAEGGTTATVSPQNWLYLQSYSRFRKRLFTGTTWNCVARVGSGATATRSWDTLRVLLISTNCVPAADAMGVAIDALSPSDEARAAELRTSPLTDFRQSDQLSNPDARFAAGQMFSVGLLSEHATAYQGVATGDYARFGRFFWEIPLLDDATWVRQQSTVEASGAYSGREHVVFWQNGAGDLAGSPQARIQGQPAWGKAGVAITQTRALPVTLYTGEMFDNNTAALVPHDPRDLPALWAFCSSAAYVNAVRAIDSKLGVTNATLAKVPFDAGHWREVAEARGPLPQSGSDDATQWLFGGRPNDAADPLLVAVARLLGFRWPDQSSDDGLDSLVDEDGIVCLPSVRGEHPAAERLQELISRACGSAWSPSRTLELLRGAGSSKADLGAWLRDDFFKAHCKLFGNRPFVWHVWDGRKDGFAALLNYHRLERATLEKLTYSYLGDWIERQRAGVRDDLPGAEDRVAAARGLRERLEMILEGEPPCDIFVRWKALAGQPIGWDPDIDDGVRVNIRPFVEAGVLRAPFNIHWRKDRGRNADGSERLNELHFTTVEKRAARARS